MADFVSFFSRGNRENAESYTVFSLHWKRRISARLDFLAINSSEDDRHCVCVCCVVSDLRCNHIPKTQWLPHDCVTAGDEELWCRPTLRSALIYCTPKNSNHRGTTTCCTHSWNNYVFYFKNCKMYWWHSFEIIHFEQKGSILNEFRYRINWWFLL